MTVASLLARAADAEALYREAIAHLAETSVRTELARAVFGADRLQKGEMFLAGERIALRSPSEAIRHGIGPALLQLARDGV